MIDSFCIQTVLNGTLERVTVTSMKDVISSNKPVYTSGQDFGLELHYTSEYWQVLQHDKPVYRASASTESPPPSGYLDVTVDPPISLSSMKINPGTCSKSITRACPANTEFCERVAITLTGKNFGVQSRDWQLELGSIGGNETINVTQEDIIYFSHSNIRFNLPPGQGISRFVNLTVSELTLVNGSIPFGYQVPELIGYETNTGNLSTCGGYTITLYGKNFGSTGAKVLIGGRVHVLTVKAPTLEHVALIPVSIRQAVPVSTLKHWSAIRPCTLSVLRSVS
ncbi:hypothetical protein DVH05_025990 [Phytophthora capsici]|nr:hypothetical protein DVH05_025990 [Phytophthora capsici]